MITEEDYNKIPTITKIDEDAKELENSVNKLISDFKQKYPEPLVVMVHGGYYRVYVEQNMREYFKLYQKTYPSSQ